MPNELNRRDFVKTAAALAGLAGVAGRAKALAAKPAARKSVEWPFYAFDNGLRTIRTLEGKCKLLKDLGYAGVEYHMNHAGLPKMLEQLDKHGLQLNAVYTVPWLEDPMDPKLPASIKRMKGRPTRIELAIRSKQFKKPSDPKGDPKAADLLKSVSDACADTGPVVSIYPHTWFWTERVEDGVRLAKLVDRRNVGTNFNLVHWKWVKNTRPLEAILREALPHLFSVTINGLQSKKGGRDSILSLDQGDYDLTAFMALVRKVGYTGPASPGHSPASPWRRPVGLQCYSVKGPSEEHLKRSMQKWREILRKLAEASTP